MIYFPKFQLQFYNLYDLVVTVASAMVLLRVIKNYKSSSDYSAGIHATRLYKYFQKIERTEAYYQTWN